MVKKRKTGELRIIGGSFRGRIIQFTPSSGIRPTADRLRETLFNWLAPYIHGANCIDVFAGSGALGIEALSRGAQKVFFIDVNSKTLQQIKTELNRLDNQQLLTPYTCEFHCLSIPKHNLQCKPADIVFIDPPFGQSLVEKTCKWLENQHLLNDHALIYLETEKDLLPLPIPSTWYIHHAKLAGEVRYYLIERTEANT